MTTFSGKYDRKRFDEAVRLVREVDAVLGRSSIETRFLADMWEGKKPRASVIAQAESSLTDPREAASFETYLAVGEYFFNTQDARDLDKAFKYLSKAQELAPDEFAPQLALLRYSMEGERRPELLKIQANTCLAMRPDLAPMWQCKGIVFLEFGDSDPERMEKAAYHFRKALELDATRADAHLHLGSALYGQKNYAEALKEFSSCIDLRTTDEPITCTAFANRSLIRALLRDWKGALSDFEEVDKNRLSQTYFLDKYNLACSLSL